MTRSRGQVVVFASVAAVALASAQAPVTVPVTGQVVDASTGIAVAGAEVRLNVATIDGAQRRAVTADDGRFLIESVPAGRYYMFAMKSGFFAAGLNDEKQPGASDLLVIGWPAPPSITLRLRAQGSLKGHVSDDEGRAISGARVTMLSRQRVWPSWGPQWSWEPVPNISPTTANATGDYAFDAVPAGEYLLLVDASGIKPVGPSDRTFGAVYTQDPMRLDIGDTRRADIELTPKPAFDVTIAIEKSDNGPVYAQLFAIGDERRRRVAEQWPLGDEPATFRRLPPGDYLVKAEIGDRAHGEQRFTIVDRSRDDVSVRLWPAVVITGQIVWEGAARPPDRASLRPLFHFLGDEGMSAEMKERIQASTPIQLAELLPLESTALFFRRSYSATWSSESTFTLTVPRGPFVAGHGSVSSWLVKSLRVDGREATAEPIDLHSSTTSAVLTMTRSTGEVRGTVLNAAGAPDKSGWLLLFSTNPRTWPGAHANNFHVMSADHDDKGRFVFENVIPGDYYVAPASWEDIERRDPEVLLRLASTAARVRVLPNEPVTVTLKRSR